MMLKLVILLLTCLCIGFGQTPDPARVEVEKALGAFQSSWKSRDAGAAGKLIADDAVWIQRGGRVLDKEGYLTALREKGFGGMQDLKDTKVRVYGNAAVTTFSDGDKAGVERTVRTLVWIKAGEGWRIASFHSSPAAK